MTSDLRKKGGVIVAWLMGGQSTPGFVSSIAALTAVSTQLGVDLLGAIPKVSGPRIAAARNDLVEHFLSTNAEWLFMVDDDMVFDHDVLPRLLKSADKYQRPIVGGFAYAAGRDGYFSTIWTMKDGYPVRVDDYPAGKLVEVVGTGAACLLVHRRVFEKILAEHEGGPWVWFEETAVGERTIGEDFTFCLRARKAGFPVYVDTGIEFGHEKLVTINREFVANWRRTHRVLVTGTGRCGTGYVATLLNAVAIPATHEGVWSTETRPWSWQRVECSWLAVPHLESFDGPIVHLVRHPLDVINSLMGIEFFTNPVHGDYVARAREIVDLDGLEPLEQAMKFWVEMNRLIEPHASARFQIEQIGPEDFAAIAEATGARHSPHEMAAAMEKIPTNVNSRNRASFAWDDLPDGDLKVELEQLAKEYGYEL